MAQTKTKAKTTRCRTSTIKATSRASVKIKDSYYTVEYSEERIVPDGMDEPTLEEERAELWEVVNALFKCIHINIFPCFNNWGIISKS